MDQGIFVKTGNQLKVLEVTPYKSEATLQQLLKDHPQLIAGVATGESSPRLLLVKREASVSSDDVGRSYSLDHLFVDSGAVPVFVEVKLSTDTRIRREVVGQLLDYIALGVPDWPAERMRQAALASHPGEDEDELLSGQLGWPDGSEEFWRRVSENVANKKVRMVFVADRLPADLKRVIEFLNEQMRDVDVLGVEVPLYGAGDLQAYVPRVVGDTADARQTKEKSAQVFWNPTSFLAEAQSRGASESELEAMQLLLTHGADHGAPRFGVSETPGVNGWYKIPGAPGDARVWYLTVGRGEVPPFLSFYPRDIRDHGGEHRLQKFAESLRAIPGFSPAVDKWEQDGWQGRQRLNLAPLIAADPDLEATIRAIDTARLGSGQ